MPSFEYTPDADVKVHQEEIWQCDLRRVYKVVLAFCERDPPSLEKEL